MANLVLLLPNLLLAQLFILSSILDIKNHSQTVQKIAAHGLPSPDGIFIAMIAWKIIAGLGLLYLPVVSLSAWALIIFVALAMYLFKPFWKKTGLERDELLLEFSVYLAIIGGLFSLVYL